VIRLDVAFQVELIPREKRGVPGRAFGEKLLVELIPRGFMPDSAFLCELLVRGLEVARIVGPQA
jgi:hypothetical protein